MTYTGSTGQPLSDRAAEPRPTYLLINEPYIWRKKKHRELSLAFRVLYSIYLTKLHCDFSTCIGKYYKSEKIQVETFASNYNKRPYRTWRATGHIQANCIEMSSCSHNDYAFISFQTSFPTQLLRDCII